MTASVALRAAGIAVGYGSTVILSGLDLEVEEGEIHVLLGESGSGKTTLLRAIAGFEPLRRGRLEVFGAAVDVAGAEAVAPERRGIGVVFQDYALFPHLDVAGNLAFGMRRDHDQGAIAELLGAVDLAGYEGRAIAELSGGEQQRVALARALAHAPRLILFDEPFSNLNRELRRRLRRQTRELLHDRGVTAVFVTHDREEAFAIADRVSVMAAGAILETGTPRQLYQCPRTAAVARAVGDCNLLDGEVTGDGTAFECALGRAPLRQPAGGQLLLVRPEHLVLVPGAGATVTRIDFAGSTDRVELRVGERTMLAAAEPGAFAAGQSVTVSLAGGPFALVSL